MAVMIGHAIYDENGKAVGGTAGDQTGKEVCTRQWYLNGKGWVVLRCKDREKRHKIAEAMEKACSNGQIGYDQNQRNTLFNNVKNQGFDPSKTTKAVETDCSALVRVCIAYAYGTDLVGNIRTATEPEILVKTGAFEMLTEGKYCAATDALLRGDILCTPVKGHTAVVLTDGVKTMEKGVFILEMQVLKSGSKGDSVKALQTLLIGYGYSCGKYGADGSFGSGTLSAVKKYQKAKGLSSDGIVGEKTWATLLGV